MAGIRDARMRSYFFASPKAVQAEHNLQGRSEMKKIKPEHMIYFALGFLMSIFAGLVRLPTLLMVAVGMGLLVGGIMTHVRRQTDDSPSGAEPSTDRPGGEKG